MDNSTQLNQCILNILNILNSSNQDIKTDDVKVNFIQQFFKHLRNKHKLKLYQGIQYASSLSREVGDPAVPLLFLRRDFFSFSTVLSFFSCIYPAASAEVTVVLGGFYLIGKTSTHSLELHFPI